MALNGMLGKTKTWPSQTEYAESSPHQEIGVLHIFISQHLMHLTKLTSHTLGSNYVSL